jgi:hypothetical protein
MVFYTMIQKTKHNISLLFPQWEKEGKHEKNLENSTRLNQGNRWTTLGLWQRNKRRFRNWRMLISSKSQPGVVLYKAVWPFTEVGLYHILMSIIKLISLDNYIIIYTSATELTVIILDFPKLLN